MKQKTYELFLLTTVLNFDDRLSTLGHDLEREVLHIRLHLGVIEFPANETLGIEDGVVGVHGDLVLRGVTDETLVVGERDIGRGRAVTLVVGDNLDSVVLPDTDAGVGGAQVNTDRF